MEILEVSFEVYLVLILNFRFFFFFVLEQKSSPLLFFSLSKSSCMTMPVSELQMQGNK